MLFYYNEISEYNKNIELKLQESSKLRLNYSTEKLNEAIKSFEILSQIDTIKDYKTRLKKTDSLVYACRMHDSKGLLNIKLRTKYIDTSLFLVKKRIRENIVEIDSFTKENYYYDKQIINAIQINDNIHKGLFKKYFFFHIILFIGLYLFFTNITKWIKSEFF